MKFKEKLFSEPAKRLLATLFVCLFSLLISGCSEEKRHAPMMPFHQCAPVAPKPYGPPSPYGPSYGPTYGPTHGPYSVPVPIAPAPVSPAPSQQPTTIQQKAILANAVGLWTSTDFRNPVIFYISPGGSVTLVDEALLNYGSLAEYQTAVSVAAAHAQLNLNLSALGLFDFKFNFSQLFPSYLTTASYLDPYLWTDPFSPYSFGNFYFDPWLAAFPVFNTLGFAPFWAGLGTYGLDAFSRFGTSFNFGSTIFPFNFGAFAYFDTFHLNFPFFSRPFLHGSSFFNPFGNFNLFGLGPFGAYPWGWNWNNWNTFGSWNSFGTWPLWSHQAVDYGSGNLSYGSSGRGRTFGGQISNSGLFPSASPAARASARTFHTPASSNLPPANYPPANYPPANLPQGVNRDGGMHAQFYGCDQFTVAPSQMPSLAGQGFLKITWEEAITRLKIYSGRMHEGTELSIGPRDSHEFWEFLEGTTIPEGPARQMVGIWISPGNNVSVVSKEAFDRANETSTEPVDIVIGQLVESEIFDVFLKAKEGATAFFGDGTYGIQEFIFSEQNERKILEIRVIRNGKSDSYIFESLGFYEKMPPSGENRTIKSPLRRRHQEMYDDRNDDSNDDPNGDNPKDTRGPGTDEDDYIGPVKEAMEDEQTNEPVREHEGLTKKGGDDISPIKTKRHYTQGDPHHVGS